MAEQLNAKIRVVSTDTGEVADVAPNQLMRPDIEKISILMNEIVINLQNNLKASIEEKKPGTLSLQEVDLTFGIDMGVEASAELKIPIIGPVLRGGVKGGATFQVQIKLSKE